MVFPREISQTYILAGDGSSTTPAYVNAPTKDYTYFSLFAVVENVLHIFGGEQDNYKVEPYNYHL